MLLHEIQKNYYNEEVLKLHIGDRVKQYDLWGSYIYKYLYAGLNIELQRL